MQAMWTERPLRKLYPMLFNGYGKVIQIVVSMVVSTIGNGR